MINAAIEPNPAKGTPATNQNQVNGTSEIMASNETINPIKEISRKGLYECENIPFSARSITFPVEAF